MDGWKKLFIRSAGFGAGFCLSLAIILGAGLWFNSRPKPPIPWDENKIVCETPPGFGVTDDNKSVEFIYSCENKSDIDYQHDTFADMKVSGLLSTGELTKPITKKEDGILVETPIFIPSKQKAHISITINKSSLPKKNSTETDEQYHENIRNILNTDWSSVDKIVIYDTKNHYRINFPKWSPVKTKNKR